jgi:hypothetical protein
MVWRHLLVCCDTKPSIQPQGDHDWVSLLERTSRWETRYKASKCVTIHQVSNLNRITTSMAERWVLECASWWHTTSSATLPTSHTALRFIFDTSLQGLHSSLWHINLAWCFGLLSPQKISQILQGESKYSYVWNNFRITISFLQIKCLKFHETDSRWL